MLKEVRKERTNWRDNRLDQCLKQEGFSPFSSFLVTEYNYGKSVAIIEYKKAGSDIAADNRIINYCNLRKNKEYYFIVLYDYEKKGSEFKIKKFEIHPKNKAAVAEFGTDPFEVSEKEFIKFLYRIRNNTDSEYYKKSMEGYKEWFYVPIPIQSEHQIISIRHRSYAYDVPAADIDAMLCDTDNIPYVFIEYKENPNIKKEKSRGHNRFICRNFDKKTKKLKEAEKSKLYNKAIIDLGDGCKKPIPVIVVEYNLENDIFSMYEFNQCSETYIRQKTLGRKEYFKYIKDQNNFRKEKTCPICGAPLELRTGFYGIFYGCTNFKETHCKYTLNYYNDLKNFTSKSVSDVVQT